MHFFQSFIIYIIYVITSFSSPYQSSPLKGPIDRTNSTKWAGWKGRSE